MSDEPAAAEPSLAAKSPYELRVGLANGVAEADVRTALATGDMGFLHSFTTGSAVDGPGIRIVGWMTGCPWRCQYCHNPDTWTITNGHPVSALRAADEVRMYRQGLKVMSGGFTLSGGEPLLQHRFAVRLLSAVKAMGIHTAIETNGYFSEHVSDAELDKIDVVLLGLKTWTPARHRALTGMDIEPTLAFARRLAALKKRVWLRFVLVPGLTDAPDTLEGIADFAAGLGNVHRVEVLPFHQLGKFKWERLGLNYELEDTVAPTADACERACEVFRAKGLIAN